MCIVWGLMGAYPGPTAGLWALWLCGGLSTRTPLTTTRVPETAHRSSPPSPRSEGHTSTWKELRAKRRIYKPSHLDLALTWIWEIICVVFSSIYYALLVVCLQYVNSSNYGS